MSGYKDDLVSLTRQLGFISIEVHVHLSEEPSEFGLSSIKWFSLGQLRSRDTTDWCRCSNLSVQLRQVIINISSNIVGLLIKG
jgi:hypothetical protein